MIKPIHSSELNNKKIVFLAQGITSPIFNIQSLPILEELKNEFDVKIISIEDNLHKSRKTEEFKHIFKTLNDFYSLELISCRVIPPLPKIINQIIQIVPQLYKLSKHNNYVFFHARGYLPSIILHYLKKFIPIKYIFDMRGVFVDELKFLYNKF